MTHQVPEYYPSVSVLLSNILDNVGYSRADRDRKVKIATETEVFLNMGEALRKSGIRRYWFGSRGEGSTGPGLQPDIDYLRQNAKFKAVTDLSDCQLDKVNVLMVKDISTHPGYVKLQVINIPSDPEVENIVESLTIDSLNMPLLPNTRFHGFGIVSGPATHRPANNNEFSVDVVRAIRSSKWPREGYEWFKRRRFYGWPTPQQIENAWDYGCFVTPVGHPHSPEPHLEWRLSFSVAERDLTRSFEDIEMKVYILLKMIKKTFIEPVLRDAFSSYHCKVCMLWMRERTPRELWSNENLLYCLILCVQQLYDWATTGFCPDYFIATNNIYDRKIVGAKQFDLVQRLRYFLSGDCRFLLGIKCCYLGQLLTDRISGLNIPLIWDDVHFGYNLSIVHVLNIPLMMDDVHRDYNLSIENACYCRDIILKHIPQYYTVLVDYLERIMFASKHLSYIMPFPLKHAMMVLWSQLGFHIATVCKENARLLSSEQVDYLVKLASGCLSNGISIDVTSVRLKLCGLGMELGNYDLTEVCLQHISDYRMRYMYSATVDLECPLTVLKCNMRSCSKKLLSKRYSTEELLQTQVSYSVVYIPSEISITPTPMRMEMFRSIGAPPVINKYDDSWYDWGVVDSRMCLYFFQYLNFSRQGKERHRQVAMNNMIYMISTEPDILHRDTAFNLLGYSFMQENQLTNAFICFTQSLKMSPYHNAGKFYLGLLLKKVLATHRRHVHY